MSRASRGDWKEGCDGREVDEPHAAVADSEPTIGEFAVEDGGSD